MRIRTAGVLLVALALVAGACTDDDGTDDADRPTTGTEPAPEGRYQAEITRDGAGVPHITAPDYASLGFGQGWAVAEDRPCTLLDQIVKVRGERASYHGPGEDGIHVDTDFAYRHLGLHDDADDRWADQPGDVRDVVEGYVAGFNAHLDEVGSDGLSGWCAGEDWVAPITTTDLYAYISDLLLLASGRNLLTPIATAAPPEAPDADPGLGPEQEDEAALAPLLAEPGASNGWAIGNDRSTTEGGVLLGNPHFPWEGELRFWEVHLTIPGELDVYGVSLSAMPGVQLGFTEGIAWTHTVSAGRRFTIYSLDLVEGDPTTYRYGDEEREMTSTEIEVEVLQDDGTTTTERRTLWSSHYGPMLDLPTGWSAETAYTYRDANAEITTVFSQFLAMDRATGMDELQAAHEEHQGIPWVNTIATSADGRAWFADTAATPNLAEGTIEQWRSEVDAGGTAALFDDNGATLLDGSNPDNEWIDDPAAPAPGLVPYEQLPQLERDDYVFNANDSHWLAHPDQLLTGFSPMHGLEEVRQTSRTRMNAILLEAGGDGDGGPFDLESVQDALFANESLHAVLLLDEVVEVCDGAGPIDVDGAAVDIEVACDALAEWDGTYDVDSRGAIVWRELLGQFELDDRVDAGALYSDGFDPADPVGSPSTPVEDRQPWLERLARAVRILDEAGIPVDAPLGDWQFDGRTGERIPLHGGPGIEGIANVVGCCARGGSSTAPQGEVGDFVDDGLFTDLPGYPVTTGASFLLAVQFGPDGPVAEGLLTYGNPDDPDDLRFTADLERYSEKDWRPLLFRSADLAADDGATTRVVEGDR